MGELLDITVEPEPSTSPIAALDVWGFWCKYEAIGVDDQLRLALLSGEPTQDQRTRAHHMIQRARDWLIALEPASRRPS